MIRERDKIIPATWVLSAEVWDPTSGVPDSQNADGFVLGIHPIDNAIGSEDGFADGAFGCLWYGPIGGRQLGGSFDTGKDAICEASGGFRIIQCDIPNDLFQILSR